jgi:phosphate transport system substrate-binding protein
VWTIAVNPAYTSYAISHQLPVNRLSLNGVEATPENVETGKYQIVPSIGFVSKKTKGDSSIYQFC